MPSFDIVKQSHFENSFRNESIRGQFDLKIEKIVETFKGDLNIENIDWNIGVIYGASGSGKTSIINELFSSNIANFKWDNSKSVLDNMPSNLSTEEITHIFNSVGFATVWSWLKPFNVLSQGEQMRVNLARALLQSDELIVFDEFTSVINREVAKHSSFAISKAIRKKNKKFIAVSCHYDVLDWLEPDWVFNTDKMEFKYVRGRLRRPPIKIKIYKTDKRIWNLFKKYHYLNSNLNQSAACYVGVVNNQAVCFFAVMHFPHSKVNNFKRGHRLVVLPDYQGLGIGHSFSSAIAETYKDKGFRFIITSSTKSLLKQRLRDPRWVVTRQSRTMGGSGIFQNSKIKNSTSGNKYTYAYEYIGSKQ